MSLKNKLLVGTTLLSLLFNPLKATAEETIPKQPLAIERTLEEEISKPKIEINFNYKIESEQKGADYSELSTTNLTCPINIINISSYQELITQSTSLLEREKLILASKISSLLGYDLNLQDIEVMSQDDFFYNLQNFLPVGVCRHIATHAERYLNDIGIKSAAVSGKSNRVGHVYDISKIENGTAIIDYNIIFIVDTKNIEKTLEAYQKYKRNTTFQHLFFEDAEFKYRLITKDGKNFLDFIEYDESQEPLKNALIQDFKSEPYFKANISLEDFLTSAEFNLFGLFLKAGEIRGNSNSALEKLTLFQTGFKRNFSFFNNKIIINPDLSFIFGQIFQNALDNPKILGINGNLIFATNREKGFNLSSRIAGNLLSAKNSSLFYDAIFGTGISYRIPIKNINIEPYVTSQFAFFPKDIGTYAYRPKLSELTGGTNIDIKFNNVNLSIDPYYLWRIGEQGFGGSIKFEGKNLGIKAEGDATWSNYEFNPDKINLKIGPYLNLGKLHIGMDYELERTNYDKEIDNQHLFGLEGTVKF